MRKGFISAAIFAAALFASAPAQAQSGCSYIIYGAVLTAAQWQACFQAKADFLAPGVVSSVSNIDGTLTISPTTGNPIASLNLSHANTWSGQQTFVAPVLGEPDSVNLTHAVGLPLTTGVTGILPVANGGTGLASGTSGGIPYFSGSGAISSSGVLTANRIILGGGAGTTPAVLGSLGTTTTVLHGNASGAPSFGAVANGDMATMATLTVKANVTGGSATPTDSTLSAIIDADIASTQGDVLYRNATTWVALPPGSAGQALTSGGAAANPSWSGAAAATITAGTTAVAGGVAADAVLANSHTGNLLAATGITVPQVATMTGNWTSIPTLTLGGDLTLIGRANTVGTGANYAHESLFCNGCNIYPGSSGTAGFVGTDGSNTPIIGNAAGTHGFHMTVLGPSVDAECDECVVIGHQATATVNAAGSIVIGSQASNTGAAGDILIGETDTGGSSPNVGLFGVGFGSGSGYSIQLDNATCPRQTNGETIEIGYDACASAPGHVVLGGTIATAVYLGAEGHLAPVFAAEGILGAATGGDEGAGTLNIAGFYYSNGTIGVTCSGTPTSSFASTKGIVTHC